MKKINEDKWFQTQQGLLLWMANTENGRDLLGIDKRLPRIKAIGKNFIAWTIEFLQDKGEIRKFQYRTGAKYADIIRIRWAEFQEYAQYYYAQNKSPILFPVAPVFNFAYAVSTFYPDPSPETTTVDGRIGRTGVSESWATIRTTTGNDAQDAETSGRSAWYATTLGGGAWSSMYRGIFGFDLTTLVGEIISANLSLMTIDRAITFPGGTHNVRITTSTPASNIALVNGDYLQVGTSSVITGSDPNVLDFTNEVYKVFALNALGLAQLTTIANFGVRMANDADNTEPTSTADKQAYIQTYFADNATLAKDPKLEVTTVIMYAKRLGVVLTE